MLTLTVFHLFGLISSHKFHLAVFFQLVFSFCDKLFNLLIKDIEAMDPSILKGENASGKKQKVSLSHNVPLYFH